MEDPARPAQWFCRRGLAGRPEGPFDLARLAGLLTSGDITGDTLTQKMGDDDWIPFRDRQEFQSAQKMRTEMVAQRLKDEAEDHLEPWWTPRRLYYLGTLVFGSLALLFFPRNSPNNQGMDLTWLVKAVHNALRHIWGT
jgi:hypothetical protein